MRPRRLGTLALILLLVAALATLNPIAEASPPDPTWIKGFYDNADFDDVIGLITAGSGLINHVALVELRPDALVLEASRPVGDNLVAALPPSSPQPRAPPAV